MSNPAFFFAIAGISMSFAGFAGLFLALRPRDSEWQRFEIGQIKGIVSFAMTALFSALSVVALSGLIGETVALRVVAGVALVFAFYQHQIRVGTAWSRWPEVERLTRRQLIFEGGPFVIVAIAEQLLLLATVLQPSQELFELALTAMVASPALTFVLVVSQVGSATKR